MATRPWGTLRYGLRSPLRAPQDRSYTTSRDTTQAAFGSAKARCKPRDKWRRGVRWPIRREHAPRMLVA